MQSPGFGLALSKGPCGFQDVLQYFSPDLPALQKDQHAFQSPSKHYYFRPLFLFTRPLDEVNKHVRSLLDQRIRRTRAQPACKVLEQCIFPRSQIPNLAESYNQGIWQAVTMVLQLDQTQ